MTLWACKCTVITSVAAAATCTQCSVHTGHIECNQNTHTPPHARTHTTKKNLCEKRAVNSCFNSVNDESVRFPYYNRIQFTNWFKINSSSATESEAKQKKVWRIAMHKIIIFVQSMILVNKIVSNVFFLYVESLFSLFSLCVLGFFFIVLRIHIGVSVTV